MFVIILAVEASRCARPARPVYACIVIYGSLSSPTTTRLRHNHVRFTNTCIIYTDLFRRRAYAGGLLQSYSVRVKSAVTQHALSVLFYGKIRSHQWTLQLNLPIIFKCQFKNRINWPSNVVIADNVYDIKVIGVPIFYFQIGNTIPYYVAVRVMFICTMRLLVTYASLIAKLSKKIIQKTNFDLFDVELMFLSRWFTLTESMIFRSSIPGNAWPPGGLRPPEPLPGGLRSPQTPAVVTAYKSQITCDSKTKQEPWYNRECLHVIVLIILHN